MLKTKTVVGRRRRRRASRSTFEGEKAPAEPQLYDLVLVAVGRSPNGKQIGAREGRRRGRPTAASSPSTSRCARTCAHILRDRRHRRPADARAQGRARRPRRRRSRARARSRIFDARQIPSVAYTDPEVAWAGVTEDECKAQGIKYRQGGVPVGGVGPRDRQRPRRGLHEAAVRRGDASRDRRRHRRHACRRPDQRDLRSRSRWAATPSTSARRSIRIRRSSRIDRHGRRGVRRRLHRPAAGSRRNSAADRVPPTPDQSRMQPEVTETSMQAARKPLYTSLYFQVIVAIVIGVAARALLSRTRRLR